MSNPADINHLEQSAENDKDAQYKLACLYYNGEGMEKNLEKAFYWYQKAAEKGINDAMNNLASCYKNGEGTEKNLEKAIYWYQKAARNGHTRAQYNLALLYKNDDETEKNSEKAFYWYQKAAENGDDNAMYNLGICYENGEGTKKNLEKAFYWYQKAAENGDNVAMNNLIICYKNGKGTEKNLEKAFYWYQKAAESGKVNELYNKCEECEQPYTCYQWCQQCNSKRFQQDFLKWTSKNEFIDKFIQEAQLLAKNINEVLEWIPYNRLKNINYDEGGFSPIDKAIWLDGPIDSWNFDEQKWNRWTFQNGYEVILKNLNDSSDLNDEFLNKWKYHYNCQKKSFSKFVRIFGITQDPNSLNYIVIMSYVKEGSLRKCFPNIVKFNWHDKLRLLEKIILGLRIIHESGLVHCNLYDSNILISNNEIYINSLQSCRPINNLQSSEGIYGVLPYMAPEVLRGKPYTSASDIYSFSMIMWEFTSGVPPFDDRVHDHHLSISICEGERPEIVENTPNLYIDLMKACWNPEPTKRPTLEIIENTISEWLSCFNRYEIIGDIEYIKDDDEHITNIDNLQVINIINEFSKVLVQRQANNETLHQDEEEKDDDKVAFSSFSSNSDKSECLDCEI